MSDITQGTRVSTHLRADCDGEGKPHQHRTEDGRHGEITGVNLIPADGFYEWNVIDGRKTKQLMHLKLKDGALFAFAGLWTWGGDEVGPT